MKSYLHPVHSSSVCDSRFGSCMDIVQCTWPLCWDHTTRVVGHRSKSVRIQSGTDEMRKRLYNRSTGHHNHKHFHIVYPETNKLYRQTATRSRINFGEFLSDHHWSTEYPHEQMVACFAKSPERVANRNIIISLPRHRLESHECVQCTCFSRMRFT